MKKQLMGFCSLLLTIQVSYAASAEIILNSIHEPGKFLSTAIGCNDSFGGEIPILYSDGGGNIPILYSDNSLQKLV